MLNTQLFQYFVVLDKNSNKTNNDVWETNFDIWETAVHEQGEYILGMLVILFCYCQTGTKELRRKRNIENKLKLRLNLNLCVVLLD